MTKKSVLKKNDIVTLSIEDVTLEGSGVAKHDGFAVFVPNAAVGDLVEAIIIKTTNSYAVGKILNIIKASEDRIDLDCSVAKRCGGCAFRHILYPAEAGFCFGIIWMKLGIRMCSEK